MRRDPLRTLRLIFLLGLFVTISFTLPQVVAQHAGGPNIILGPVVLVTVFGLRVVEFRRSRPVPLWVDAVELVGVFAVLSQMTEIYPIISTFFITILFRAAVGRLARLIGIIIGYLVVWTTAAIMFPTIVTIAGAMFSMPTTAMLVYGMRKLLLRLQEQQQAQTALLDAVLRRLPFPVVVTDDSANVVLVNSAANELIGWSNMSRPSLADLNVQDVEQRPVDLRTLVEQAADGVVAGTELEVRLTRDDGTVSQIKVQSVPTSAETSRNSGVILALLDITAQRTYEQQLHQAAHYDMLTGLPNRRLLWEWLTVAHTNAVPYGILLIDLNDFKLVNDTLGHAIGDELLVAVGRRLQAVVEPATVARLGGDEFAVMLPHASLAQAQAAATAVREAFTAPMILSCGPVPGHGTVGLAVAQAGQSPDDVIAEADAAMYQAKALGKNRTRSDGLRTTTTT